MAGVPAKWTGTVTGDGTSTALTATHGLGTTELVVCLWEVATGNLVMTQTRPPDNNTITFTFATAPAAGEVFRAVVIG